MKDLIEGAQIIGIPTTILIILVGMFLIMQIVGEFLEFKGKIVPEFLKVRKFFKRRKEEKQKPFELLNNVQKTLNEINAHYSTDNIAKRNEWMSWVNDRAIVYDKAVNDLLKTKIKLEEIGEMTLDSWIEQNRDRILDFATKVSKEDCLVSKEEFNRIFKVYERYENVLEKYHKTNGEVDIADQVIRESYENHMKNNTFLEDIRGYYK